MQAYSSRYSYITYLAVQREGEYRKSNVPHKLDFLRLYITVLRPLTMETQCSKVIFPNYSKKKPVEDTLVPPLWGTREKMFVFLGLFGHFAVRGGTCAFMLKIVNTLVTNSSRDDRPSIST